tara:strand:- start:475 stop:1290 length:816 start_codon:yes stop_codon:yes gene_type:complete
MTNIFSIKDKFIILTGSCGLLGTHFSSLLASQNANLILIDINQEKIEEQKQNILKEYDSEVICYECDISSEKSILKIVKDLKKKSLKPSGLINNAAINPSVENTNEFDSLEDYSLANWNRELSVGLTGAFLCSKHFGKLMANNSAGGSIVNIASDLSLIAPDQRLYEDLTSNGRNFYKPITYSVIKFGLVGMTKYLASYWAKKNIRCNSISPGGIFNNQEKNFLTKIEKLIPLSRMAELDDISGSLIYLLSDSSEYLTGVNLVIDGGRTSI